VRRLRVSLLFSRLALAAIVLLSTMPTLGRLAARPEALPHAMSAAGHDHTMPARQPAGDPLQPEHAHVHDCPYCLLLAGALPTAAIALGLTTIPSMSPAWGHAAPARQHRIGAGLGARGPPFVV
jgi:DUF2946 family protein